MKNSARSYRTSAAEGATHIGVLLSTYDTLAEDMCLAGQAVANSDIATRCRYSNHATLLLGHLESWVPLLDDVVLQESLTRFYAYLRAELLRLQASPNESAFSDLAMRVCETRAVWQKKQSQRPAPIQPAEAEIPPPKVTETAAESRFSWSA
jgi:flagellin-specific chaperone FliS